MDDNNAIVIRAFSGFDKEATGASCPGAKIRSKGEGRGMGVGKGEGPVGIPVGKKKKYKLRYGKKATIVKESLAGNSDKDVVDVEVERVAPTHVKAANQAMANLTEDPSKIRPSGVSNAAVAKVSLLRSKAKAEKAKQDQLAQVGDAAFGKSALVADPEGPPPNAFTTVPMPSAPPPGSLPQTPGPSKYKFGQFSSELLRLLAEQIQNKKVKDALEGAAGEVEGFDLGSLLPKTAAAIPGQGGQGQSGQPDPYAAMEQMQQDIGVVQKAIPGMNADAILQGQQAGLDMTPGGIKKRIGAHEMIAKGKKILKDENKNGVPDVAEASMGGNPGMMQQQGQPGLTAMAKLRTPDLTKIADDEEGGAETPQEEAAEGMDPEVMQQLLNVIAEKGQSIDDEDVHTEAESMGVNPHEAEEQIYRTLAELMGGKNDIIPGGLAAGMPTSMFPQEQIAKGTEVELEHSSNPALAQEIAKDHLTEGNDYYEPRLENLEKSMDKARESGKIEATGEGTEKHTENKERKDQDVEALKESALDRVQELVKSASRPGAGSGLPDLDIGKQIGHFIGTTLPTIEEAKAVQQRAGQKGTWQGIKRWLVPNWAKAQAQQELTRKALAKEKGKAPALTKEQALNRVQELVKNSVWMPYHREQTKLLKEHYTPENMAKFKEWNKTQPVYLGGNPFMSWLRETNPEAAAGIDAKMKPIEERLRAESKAQEAARRKRNPKLWNPGSPTDILRWSKLRRKLPKGAFHVGGGKFVSESDLADMTGKQDAARQSLKTAAAQDSAIKVDPSKIDWSRMGGVVMPGSPQAEAMNKRYQEAQARRAKFGPSAEEQAAIGKLMSRLKKSPGYAKLMKKRPGAGLLTRTPWKNAETGEMSAEPKGGLQWLGASKLAAAAQDAKKKEEEEETKPGIEFLASASDTPPKKAPTKKPEKESENEAQTEKSAEGYKWHEYIYRNDPWRKLFGLKVKGEKPTEQPKVTDSEGEVEPVVEKKEAALNPKSLKAALKMAGKITRKGVISKREAKSPIAKRLRTATKTAGDMGEGSAVPKTMSDLPLRDGFKSTNREQMFNDLSKWSLGARI